VGSDLKNHGKPVLLRDKISNCVEKAEFSLLQEDTKNCKLRQLSIEQRLAAIEKICFELMASNQRFTKDINSLKLWRDHKLRS